jgi:hypothetical protein
MAPSLGYPPLLAGRPARQPGWPHRFNALVLQHLHTPFAWGVHDCLSWAADVALALHGTDTLGHGRAHCQPRHSARQALRRLRLRGGPIVALERGFFAAGLAAVPVGQALVGDLLFLPASARWPALAVCNGAVALAPGAQGLVTWPVRGACTAWGL